jgi:hypothetical protein
MWKTCWLYTVFIGRNDRNGVRIPDLVFDNARDSVENNLLTQLGGLTKIRVLEGWGRTLNWADEQSTLLAVITDSKQADELFADCATMLAQALSQEQVWVAKQQTDLFIAEPR